MCCRDPKIWQQLVPEEPHISELGLNTTINGENLNFTETSDEDNEVLEAGSGDARRNNNTSPGAASLIHPYGYKTNDGERGIVVLWDKAPAVSIRNMPEEFYYSEEGIDPVHPPLKIILVWSEVSNADLIVMN